MALLKIGVRLYLIFVIFDCVNCLWHPSRPSSDPVCQTPQCQKRGAEYLENINTSAHPCNDFFNFACGNWMNKQKTAPKYLPEWSTIDTMRNSILKEVRDLLEKTRFGQYEENFLRVQSVYKICTTRPEYPMKNSADIAAEIMSIRRKAQSNLWEIHNEYLKATGDSAFFDFVYLVNRRPQEPLLLTFLEPESAYGAIFHGRNWKEVEKQNYLEFLFQMMKSLKLPKTSDTTLRKKLDNVFNLRTRLNEIAGRSKNADPDVHNTMTLSELEAWFKQSIPNPTKTQKLPWENIVKIILNIVPRSKVLKAKMYSIRRKQYFLEMMDILKTTSEQVLVDHMEVYFVETHLRLSKEMYNLLEQTSVKPEKLLHYIRERYKSRWETCIQELNVGETLERLLHSRWFSEASKKAIDNMMKNIKKAMEVQIKSTRMVSESDYAKIVAKLNGITPWIGIPPSSNVGSSPAEFNANYILSPNAHLNYAEKWMYIHASMAQSPIFEEGLPEVYNYGGMGSSIGHELYHVMADCGTYYNGGPTVSWWSEEMWDRCEQNKYCYVKAYNITRIREYQRQYNIKLLEVPDLDEMDPDLTFEEDFPDHMGLDAAYKAFQKFRQTNSKACQVLPQFKGYSCEHMFFLTYATSFCGYYTPSMAMHGLIREPHSIFSVRVNGPLSMNPDFINAFGCAATDAMNAPEKCYFWN